MIRGLNIVNKTRMTVTLAGSSFNIVSTDSVEYMRKLEGMVNRRVESVRKQYPSLSGNRCTLLAMLNMADELEKLRAEEAACAPKPANRSFSGQAAHEAAPAKSKQPVPNRRFDPSR